MSATCQHCGVKTASAADVARRDGWILWEGYTLGGQHVVREYCPKCAGRTKNNEDEEAIGWAANCWTCLASAKDELSVEAHHLGGLTKAEAQVWAEEHQCEPAVHVEASKSVGVQR